MRPLRRSEVRLLYLLYAFFALETFPLTELALCSGEAFGFFSANLSNPLRNYSVYLGCFPCYPSPSD